MRHDRIGPLLGKLQICLRVSGVDGVAADLNGYLWVGLQNLGNVCELLLG
jgi:hypothetical protein